MACSSSNPHVTLEIGEECTYPYPSHLYNPSLVTLKLSERDEYGIWKTQMLCLLQSHGMLGFVDGILVSSLQSSSSAFRKEKAGVDQTHHMLWSRSDALVKGWILGSLSKKTLVYVLKRLTEKHHQERNNVVDFSAKEVWDELHTMYAPAVLVAEDTPRYRETAEVHQSLYEDILLKKWDRVDIVLTTKPVTVIEKITNNGNTTLHVALGNCKEAEILEKLLERILQSAQLSDVLNSDGSTLLHVASIIGNLEAAKILVGKYPDLLLAKDNEGHTPLTIALSNMHTDTAELLLQHINTDREKDLFSGTSGDELLVTVISSKKFRLAHEMLGRYKTLHSDAPLMALAQNFPSKRNMLLYYIGSGQLNDRIDTGLAKCVMYVENCLPPLVQPVLNIFMFLFGGFYLILKLLMLILETLVWRFNKEIQNHDDAMRLLRSTCRYLTKENKRSNTSHHYYTNSILEATRQNAYVVALTILCYFPNAISSANEDGHTIIQYAVINRSEKVYSLLYQMNEHRNVYRTFTDSCRNNLLHLAARLAPSNKLNLISGAALQLQRELQWFENSFDETPKMVFSREHKDLVIEGEKWMKTTAESYTITATLIITIVFAAAITVPGGSNESTGVPIFLNTTAFTIFAISDAISLFTAVTSLLMFLSILTARFAEEDFLCKLPTKLMIGLTTLFISTTAMVVAFSATLYLVFGQSNSRILTPIAMFACLPITSFVTLQFPLVLELMRATYGPNIFGKRSDESLEHLQSILHQYR